MLRMGVLPLLLNAYLAALLSLQDHPRRGQGSWLCSAALLRGHCALCCIWHACYMLFAFILTLREWKKKSEYSCQGSKVKLMGLAVSVILNKSKMCLSAHQEREMPFGCSLTSFYLCTSILMVSLCWPPCVLWGSTVQMVLRGTSLVSPLVLAKSKHGAVPSAKCSL